MDDKTCTKCNNVFPATTEYFYKNKNQKDGLRTWCKNCVNENYLMNKTKRNLQNRLNYRKNRDDRVLKCKIWRQNNPDHYKQYYQKNKAEIFEKRRKYRNERYKKDPKFKLCINLRNNLRRIILGARSISSLELLGCTIEEFKQHIESQWKSGMNWNNWSKDGWHIDHIYPLSKIDPNNIEELARVCHYSNFQPLWAKENIVKGNKVDQNPQQ